MSASQHPLIHSSLLSKAFVIFLAGLSVVAAGASGVLFEGPFSPLLVGAAIAAVVVLLYWLKKPIWGLYAAIFIVFLPLGLIPFETHSLMNRAITVSAFAVWVIQAVLQRRKIILTPAAVFMLAFLLWSLMSLAWTGSVSVSSDAIQTYVLRCVLYLILMANLLRTKRDLDGLMRILSVNGWVLMVLFVEVVLTSGYTPGSRLKILGMNENEAAVFCLVAMPGVFWGAIQSARGLRSPKMWFSLLYLVLATGLIAMSGSRGGIISLLVVLAGFLLFKRTRIFALLGFGMMALGVLALPDVFTTIINRLGVESGDTMLGGREALWKAAWTMISRHFWLGVGIGYSPRALLQVVRAYTSVFDFESVAIHNPLLVIWAETGIIGLLLYCGVLTSAVLIFIRRAFRALRSNVPWPGVYFALVSPVFLGYMLSWVKGGGAESEFTFFFMIALLLFPAVVEDRPAAESAVQGAGAPLLEIGNTGEQQAGR